jgi:hypothetical protein
MGRQTPELIIEIEIDLAFLNGFQQIGHRLKMPLPHSWKRSQ